MCIYHNLFTHLIAEVHLHDLGCWNITNKDVNNISLHAFGGCSRYFGEVYIDKEWFNHGACICLASVGTIKTFLK